VGRVSGIENDVRDRLPAEFVVVRSLVFDAETQIGVVVCRRDSLDQPASERRHWAARAPIDAPDAADILIAGLGRAWLTELPDCDDPVMVA